MELCINKKFWVFCQKLLLKIKSRCNFSPFWVFKLVFRYCWWKVKIFYKIKFIFIDFCQDMDRNWQELKGSRAAGTHSNMVRTDIFKMDPLAHLILGKNYQWKSNLGLTFPHVKFTQNLLNSYKTGQKLTRSFSVFYSTETST